MPCWQGGKKSFPQHVFFLRLSRASGRPEMQNNHSRRMDRSFISAFGFIEQCSSIFWAVQDFKGTFTTYFLQHTGNSFTTAGFSIVCTHRMAGALPDAIILFLTTKDDFTRRKWCGKETMSYQKYWDKSDLDGSNFQNCVDWRANNHNLEGNCPNLKAHNFNKSFGFLFIQTVLFTRKRFSSLKTENWHPPPKKKTVRSTFHRYCRPQRPRLRAPPQISCKKGVAEA